MAKTYLIELPDSNEIGDLVSLMANFVKAEYRLITILETSSECLAHSVASLLQTASHPAQVLNLLQTADPSVESLGRSVAVGDEPGEDVAIAGKPCMICGKPAMKRSTICGRPECRRERQKRWDIAWREKNGKALKATPENTIIDANPVSPLGDPLQGSQVSAPQGAGAAEDEQPAAAVLPPFFALGSQMLVFNQLITQTKLLETSQILKEIFAEMYPEGNLFQDASNGRFYEVRQGNLVPVVVSAATAAAVRGLAEKPAA